MQEDPSTPATQSLFCDDCGEESKGTARRWRAYLEGDQGVEIYCPSCAADRFDDDGA